MAEPVPSTAPVREQRFERKMSDAEALMWNVEKDPWLNPSGGSVSILDRMPDVEHLRAQLAAAVVTVPRLMEHVVGGFGRYSPPVWRPDPEFDLDQHLRVIALPAPGTMRQLLDTVTRIYQDPYDRTRPLWAMYVIDGLEGGRAASLWKIHHAVADGTGAARLSELFIQPTRDAPMPPPVDMQAVIAAAVAADDAAAAADRPSVVESVLGTATHVARRQAGIAKRLAGEMAMWGADPRRARDTVESAARTIGQLRDQITGGEPATTGEEGEEGEDAAPGRLPAVAHPFPPPPPRGDDVPARRRAGRGEGPRRLAERLVRHRRRQRRRRLPRGARRAVALAEHELRGQHAGRQGDRRQLVHAEPVQRPGRADGPGRTLQAAQRDDGRSSGRRSSGAGALSGLAGLANLLPTSLVTSIARSQAAKMDFATSNLRSARRRFHMSGARVDESYAFGPLAGTAFNLTAMSLRRPVRDLHVHRPGGDRGHR